jgi:hypothetical protein
MPKYRQFLFRQKVRSRLLKAIDTFYTILGMILIAAFLLVSIPFVLLIEWMSGND